MLDELRDATYDMIGNPEDLLPPERVEGVRQEPSAERLVEVAVMALADAAYYNHVAVEARREQRQRRRSRVPVPSVAEAGRTPVVRRLRRKVAGLALAARGRRDR